MEDLKERVQLLRKNKSINYYLSVSITIFLLGAIASKFRNITYGSEKILLIYAEISLLIILPYLFRFIKNLPIKEGSDQLEKYQEAQVSRTLEASKLAPYFFFIPILMASASTFSLDIILDRKPAYWIWISVLVFWLFALYRWWGLRKLILKEYKRIHGVNPLTILRW